MSQILNRVRDVDPNDSESIKDALNGFFQNLPKHVSADCNIWLRALQDVINRFPKYCGTHRNTIETYLTYFLSVNNYYNVIEAAKCALAVQQVRTPQDKGDTTAKTYWRNQMNVLCQSAHKLISTIFAKDNTRTKNSQEVNKKDTFNSHLAAALSNLWKIQEANVINKKSLLCTRLRNIFIFIQAMLVEIYPEAKPIRPHIILEVIVESLSASSASKNIDSADIAIVKTQALKILDALVACLGSNLIPYSALVFRFITETLRWTSENPNEQSGSVRVCAYGSLSRWLAALRTRRARASLAAPLLRDLAPPRRALQLQMTARPQTKNLSKKAKRKLTNNMLKESSIASHMPGEKNKVASPDETNDDVTIAALECAEILFTVCGILLKPATHKAFQNRLIAECYNLSAYNTKHAMCLLRALEALRKSASPNIPPHTQYCLQLYSVLVNNPQREISIFCSQALLDIRMHLHCSPPSLNFTLEVSESQKNKKDSQYKLSERNRAVLESLLGKERMPTEDLSEEEIIEIPDEPAEKRTRLDSEEPEIIESDEVAAQDNTSDEKVPDVTNDEDVEKSGKHNDDETIEIIDEVIDITDEAHATDDVEAIETEETEDIHNAETQYCATNSTDVTQDVPEAMEVGYDYPVSNNDSVGLENLDGDNLPSTNETDDIQINCGQQMQSSQEPPELPAADIREEVDNVTEEAPAPVQNGKASEEEIITTLFVRDMQQNDDAVSVEDMMADFVDEVNEDNVNAV